MSKSGDANEYKEKKKSHQDKISKPLKRGRSLNNHKEKEDEDDHDGDENQEDETKKPSTCMIGKKLKIEEEYAIKNTKANESSNGKQKSTHIPGELLRDVQLKLLQQKLEPVHLWDAVKHHLDKQLMESMTSNMQFYFMQFSSDRKDEKKVIPEYQIFIQTLTGRTFILDVKGTDKIRTIKTKIQEKEGVDPDQQQLIFLGRPLQDKYTLEDYSVGKHKTIGLVTRLAGS